MHINFIHGTSWWKIFKYELPFFTILACKNWFMLTVFEGIEVAWMSPWLLDCLNVLGFGDRQTKSIWWAKKLDRIVIVYEGVLSREGNPLSTNTRSVYKHISVKVKVGQCGFEFPKGTNSGQYNRSQGRLRVSSPSQMVHNWQLLQGRPENIIRTHC